jgi:hypothetical protein
MEISPDSVQGTIVSDLLIVAFMYFDISVKLIQSARAIDV